MQHETIYLKQPIAKNSVGNKPQDELDLINLIQKTISFIDTFKFVFIGCLAAGLALAFYLYYSSPMQYSTRLMAHSLLLSNQDEIEIIENWKDLLAKGEKSQLASMMNCDVSVIEKLSNISGEEILKTYAPNNPNSFLISVSVKDTSILDELQNGIVYGLNNSPYVKEKLATRKARDIELIEKVNDEITKLNTTKSLIDSMIKTKNGNTSLLVDISRINAEWIELNEKLLGYREDLKFVSAIQVMENFSKGKMARPGFLKLSFLGIAAGCFVGYIISLFLYVLRKIKALRIKPATSS